MSYVENIRALGCSLCEVAMQQFQNILETKIY